MLNQIFNSTNYYFNPYALPVFFVALASLFFGLFVFWKNRRSKTNLSFFLLTLNATAWLLGMGLVYLSKYEDLAVLWYKVFGFCSVTFISLNSYLFILSLTKRLEGKKVFLIISYLVGFSFYVINLKTDWLVPRAREYFWGYYPIYAWLAYFFLGYFVSFAAMMFITCFKAIKKTKSPLEKTQLKYVFFAFAGAYLALFDFVGAFNIELYPFGYIPIFFFLGIIAYSIAKYRLMEIGVIIRKALIYSILITIISALFVLLILFGQFFLQRLLSISLWYFIVPTALIISLIFPQLENYIAHLTDKIFFRKRYDYQKAIREASQAITTILKSADLLSFLRQTFLKTVKVKDFSLFVYQPTKAQFIQQLSNFRKEEKKELKPAIIKESSPFIKKLQQTKTPLILEEISHQIATKTLSKEKLKKLQQIEKQMKKLNIALVIPICLKDKLTGLLILKEKLSGDAFSATDLELLTTLANQTAIALENTQLYEKEKELSQLKSHFVSIAAHRLRTPLSVVKWTMFLLQETKHLKNRETLIKNAYAANEKMIALVNDLLDVSRIEEGRTIHKLTLAKLEDIVEESLKDFKQIIADKNIACSFKKAEQLPKVKIDIPKIKSVIQILIENAITYIHQGDKIVIDLKVNPSNKKELVFSIKDNGIGIPENAKSHIFEKFFRAENAAKQETEGTGLGLFIAKSIIEEHRGRIWFESKENEGTTFYFALPAG